MATSASRAWWVASLVLALVLLAAGVFQVHNLDIGLHARTGQWILDHGEVPSTNVLSELHHDYPSVHDKWGFQLLAHGLADGLGPDALILARVLLLLALFGLLASTARRLGAAPGVALLVLLLAVAATRARFLFRPDLVSLVLLAWVCRRALVVQPDGRRPGPLLLAQLLWVNLHGYFLLGWIVAGAAAVGQAVGGRRDAALRWVRTGLLMSAVCLLNPAGWRGWWHPFAILLDLRAHEDFYRASIVEFTPTFAADPRGSLDRLAYFALLGLLALVVGLGLALARRARAAATPDPRWTPTAVLLVLGFGVMSISLKRNVSLFSVAAAPVLAVWLSRRVPQRAQVLAWVGALVLAPLMVWGELSDTTSIHDGLDRRAGTGWSQLAYPDAGIRFLADELPEARVFTAFRFGSTFTGRRWPEQVASTNGNTHGYPTSWLIDVMAATSGEDPTAFDRCVEAHGSTAALVPLSTPLAVDLLRRTTWTLVALGAVEAVFVRRDAVDAVWLAERDLEHDLALGRAVSWPRTPRESPVLGVPRVHRPLTELALSGLLFGAGHRAAASEVIALARETNPEDAEALALDGLLARQSGRSGKARKLLQASLDAGGFNRFEEQVRAALR